MTFHALQDFVFILLFLFFFIFFSIEWLTFSNIRRAHLFYHPVLLLIRLAPANPLISHSIIWIQSGVTARLRMNWKPIRCWACQPSAITIQITTRIWTIGRLLHLMELFTGLNHLLCRWMMPSVIVIVFKNHAGPTWRVIWKDPIMKLPRFTMVSFGTHFAFPNASALLVYHTD